MHQNQQALQKLAGKELEEYGYKVFKDIGLNCFYNLGQTKLSDIAPEYLENEHLEFDYLIPHNKVCLIGEITARIDKKSIKSKYDKFVKQTNIIKRINFSSELWLKLGVKTENIKLFREIEYIKAFFITTKKEKYDLTLSDVQNMAIFYQSDFLRIIEYSQTLGKWSKNYLLHNFDIKHTNNTAISIYQKDHLLIRKKNRKVSTKVKVLADLYTFNISPYKLLDIAHVHRKDELPSLQDNNYNYQRLLNYEKLQEIRKTVLVDSDFMFPSNILVILSKECKYCEDGVNDSYLHIPNKYGSISIVDGQHRLFSYADEKVESIMQDRCEIQVTAIDFQTSDEKLMSQCSAITFIEINVNQTKVEISHLDQIAYDLGSDDPKVIATRIIVGVNARQKYSSFFDVNLDKINQGLIEAGTIIDAIKKITNINKIKKIANAKSDKNLLKKAGYEQLFNSRIDELSEKNVLVDKGIILLERYFNEIFMVFQNDKLEPNKKINTSFQYSKFWAGFINLLYIFIEEGFSWNQLKTELKNIKHNLIKLQNIDDYNQPLFDPKNYQIPDAKYSPTKVCTFLNKNRQKPYSVQDI
ncbi:MAG: DGQHR domain-containing protein [Pleurocapsa minor HA4230-MV1]|jgi:DGQHR domain-containing protein|nr:DGQHR domain-containing protein [Pleurocapsa minor HA4230-MV1]